MKLSMPENGPTATRDAAAIIVEADAIVELPDESELDAISGRIDAASVSSSRASDVRGQFGAAESPLDVAIVTAFSFYPRSFDDGNIAGYFRPLVEYENGPNSHHLSELPEWVPRIWEECVSVATVSVLTGVPRSMAKVNCTC